MADKLRLAVGIMEDFSCVPYIIALSNCLLYTWYGMPIVSNKWENFPLVTINGLGILFEFSFIIIYFWCTTSKRKASNTFQLVSLLSKLSVLLTFVTFHEIMVLQIKVAVTAMSVIVVFSVTALISAYAFHDHHHRKVFVGSVGLFVSTAMYGSPLVVVKLVIKTKSVEFMPFYLSFFSFLASSFWLAYGLLSRDLFLASPNLVGCPLGILQLVLYCNYRKKGIIEEPMKWDPEKNDDKTEQLQPVDDDSTINGKS
ncbi:SWEET sugar transporter [Parasponia andersonii]|uniref:Bidirectional sugar transporter SWEET n=1 Tax=Parasponia andersonii TaxID=3476 RepID=A0A2P5BMW5_PARAD|nr:SWEET sugar transporter [Parasponia andersonii]